MKLRDARPTDAPAIGGIIGDWFETTPYLPRLHSLPEDIEFAGHLITDGGVTVAEDGSVLGFVAYRAPLLSHLFVHAGARGKGIGSLLMDMVKTEAQAIELWCFQANEEARRFYESRGFEIVEETDGARNEEKIPDLRYLWKASQ